MVAHRLLASEVYQEKGSRSNSHGTEHQVGSGSTDEDAVVQESGKACHWDGQYPLEIGGRSSDDGFFVGQQLQEAFSADAVHQSKCQRKTDSPHEELANHLL